MKAEPQRIAVIGAGVAGICSAYILSQKHHVTLFEKNNRLGGHTHTIVIERGRDEGLAIDTGFIVCNNKTYPNFHRFLASLGVRWRWSDMSFGFWDQNTGLQYSGRGFDGLFAQRQNLAKPAYWRFLLEIRRFSKQGLTDLATNEAGLADETLAEYLKRRRFSKDFVQNYILPMGAAIWSTAARKMLRFPARTFLTFFRNHGLLDFASAPTWQTVVGGSHSYLKAFQQQFTGEIRLNAAPRTVRRDANGVTIVDATGHEDRYDKVVFATHADEVLPLLEAPSEEESRILGVWRYERNRVVLHTDARVLPPNRRAWASWNYVREGSRDRDAPLSMTYHMNRLQGLVSAAEYCVTLNRQQPIEERHIIRDLIYTHPLYTKKAIASQAQLPMLQGRQHSYFAGSYHGYGFHEDAVRSAVAVGGYFGLGIPKKTAAPKNALPPQGVLTA